MKLSHLSFLAVAAIVGSSAHSQDAAARPNAQPDPEATLNYIHGAWDTLTRSTTDCHSLVDIKITANPVLYLPAELAQPAEVTEAQQKCNAKKA